MSQSIRLAVLGGGAPGRAHAAGAKEAGGFKLVGAADLIPDRLQGLVQQYQIATAVPEAEKLVLDPNIDAVCVCLPTFLHAPVAIAALKAGKHVLLEMPPALSVKELKAIAKAAEKAQRVVLFSAVRRFGAAEQSAQQAIEKGYAGTIYHARAAWLRTRGVPRGTGWYQDPEKSGGGAVIDLGLPLIDLLMHLMGASPASVYAAGQARLSDLPVEEMASVVMKFDSGASADLSCAWAINQPPAQAGTICRLSGDAGAIDVYTPQGPTLYRQFDQKGDAKATAMKQPRVVGHAALLRHFKDCIHQKAEPICGLPQAMVLMQTADAINQSMRTGKAVEVKKIEL